MIVYSTPALLSAVNGSLTNVTPVNSTQVFPSTTKINSLNNQPDVSEIHIVPEMMQMGELDRNLNNLRPLTEGESLVINHHSTPTVPSQSAPQHLKPVFNVTGDSHNNRPPSEPEVWDSDESTSATEESTSTCSTEMFCDCNKSARCGCTQTIEGSVQTLTIC